MFTSLLLSVALIGQVYNGPVQFDGMLVDASGIRLANGQVQVDWTQPHNAKSLVAAQAARSAKLTPAPPAPEPTGQAPAWKTGGVSTEFMHPTGYKANGPAAQDFVAKTQSDTAETSKLHLTVIGTAEDCSRVLDSVPPEVRSKLEINDYRPTDWQVDPKIGFVSGSPAVYLQDGRRVVFRALDQYTASGLTGAITNALRKRDPNYRPDLDPGPFGKAKCPLGFTKEHWTPVIIAGVVVVVLVIGARNPREVH